MRWLVGLALLAIGAAGLIFVRRREFYRTNPAGVEEFTHFFGLLASKLLERCVTVVSTLCLVLGAVVLG